jgi:hypothetical protein
MGYDNSLTVLNNGKETDITPKELQAIEKFKEEGMPGLGALNETVMTKALDLFLFGKTYHEISTTLRIKKEIILFLGQKFNWYGTKIEQLAILDASLKERIFHASLVNQDFLLQIQQFFHKKIGRKMTRFIATNDDEAANSVDKKDIEMYFKAVDLLDKISSEKVPVNHSRPTVGLNLGDMGVTIKKIGENEVSVTPRNKTVGEMLADLANLKRAEESEVKNESYDINSTEDETKTEGKE